MSTFSIPMYEQIQNELMEQIQSGFFQPGDRIPSEKELAERYHVSRITAVKALTELALNGYIYRVQGRGSFANPLDKHLKPSALKLGGVPKNDGEPRPVSVLIPEHADYHSGSIIQGITQTLQYPECFVHLVLTHSNQLEEYALEQALKSGCAGVILFPVDCEVYSDTILRMHLNKFPLVLIDRCFPGIQSSRVCCDNEKGGWLAVEHLLSLGHRNICFIADSSFREQVTSVRYGAYVAAMTAQQLPLHAVERFNPQTFSQEEMERLLSAIRAREITAELLDRFDKGELQKIFVIYTDMKNSLTENVSATRILPFHRSAFTAPTDEKRITEPFEFFPSVTQVLENIVPSYVSGFIYSALIDSFCSEQSARMNAMNSANENAEKMLGELALAYNRIRQAAITQEITEVSAGARAQKRKRQKQHAQGRES